MTKEMIDLMLKQAHTVMDVHARVLKLTTKKSHGHSWVEIDAPPLRIHMHSNDDDLTITDLETILAGPYLDRLDAQVAADHDAQVAAEDAANRPAFEV